MRVGGEIAARGGFKLIGFVSEIGGIEGRFICNCGIQAGYENSQRPLTLSKQEPFQ